MNDISNGKVQTAFHGEENISYLGHRIWVMISIEMKN